MNLGLDIVNGIRRLHLEGDSLTREGLDEDLHIEDLNENRQSWLLVGKMPGEEMMGVREE